VPHHVVYAVDEDYWMPLYVSIHSLLANNRDLSLRVFVLYAERDETFFDNVEYLEAVHDDCSVESIRVGREHFQDAPTPHWFTEANLYRFLIGSVLPLEDENVLYLDCDTVVDGSLAELFAMDIDDVVAAATPEYKLRSFELGFPLDSLFHNAGVMYINLDQWRAHEVGPTVLDRIDGRRDVTFPVQEVLNPVLDERDLWRALHPKYNAMTNWAGVLERETDVEPVVVHYTGRSKPWQYTTDRLHTDLWWEYLEETPYSGYQPPDRTVTNRLVRARRTAVSRSKAFVSARLEPYPRVYGAVARVYRVLRG